MQSINSVLIFGKLAREPRITQGEKGKASFTLVTTKPYKAPDGEWKELSEFVPCTAWGVIAEALNGTVTGDIVMVEGRLNTRSWETDDGSKAYATEVSATKVTVLLEKITKQIIKKQDPEVAMSIDDVPF